MLLGEPIILIGPLKSGKSTVGKLLAERLGCTFTSLDRQEKKYTIPAGFDETKAEALRKSSGDWVWYTYRRSFFAVAVEQFLTEHPEGVLELGGGHPLVPDMRMQQQIAQALAPFRNVFLLMPTNDIEKSLAIMNLRLRPEWRSDDWNRNFLADDRFWQLAKHVVYTEDQSPDDTVTQIVHILSSD